MLTPKQKEKLGKLHAIENEKNRRICSIDKEINDMNFRIAKLQKEKLSLAKSVSHNMKLRNKIITDPI
jgi:hypothetical protein